MFYFDAVDLYSSCYNAQTNLFACRDRLRGFKFAHTKPRSVNRARSVCFFIAVSLVFDIKLRLVSRISHSPNIYLYRMRPLSVNRFLYSSEYRFLFLNITSIFSKSVPLTFSPPIFSLLMQPQHQLNR